MEETKSEMYGVSTRHILQGNVKRVYIVLSLGWGISMGAILLKCKISNSGTWSDERNKDYN